MLLSMAAPAPVRLPANYERVYLRAVAELEDHLASSDAPAARRVIRALVDRVVVKPGNARGGKERGLELHGDLFRMLEFAEDAASRQSKGAARNDKFPRQLGDGGTGTSVVAGTGFEPVTFRL